MNRNCINNIRKEANKALLDNINLLDIISRKIGCKDSDEAKQITYETFLECYPLWDKSKYKLSTFAYSVVRWTAIRAARHEKSNVHIPMYAHEIWTRLSRGSLDGSLEEFKKLQKAHTPPFCYLKSKTYLKLVDLYYNGGLCRRFTDGMQDELDSKEGKAQAISSDGLTEPEALAEASLNKSKLNRFLNCLPVDQKFIIENYYGLNNNTPKTLEEIGNKLNLSKERIRTKKIQALAKMHSIVAKGDRRLTSSKMIAMYLNEINKNI